MLDIREVVKKFINRETTYTEALVAIAEFEKKLDHKRKKQAFLLKKLHSLQSEINVKSTDESR